MTFELNSQGYTLKIVDIAEATYHYHIKQLMKEDLDKEIKEIETMLFYKMKEDMGVDGFNSA